jgi:hypothetical protein
MKNTAFLLTAFVSSSVYAGHRTDKVTPYVAEHCVSFQNENVHCFKQVVDENLASHFVSDFTTWEVLADTVVIEKAGITIDIVDADSYKNLEPGLVFEYTRPTNVESGTFQPLDNVRVIYQNPHHCGCAAAVIGAVGTGALAGAKTGAEVGVFFGPKGAAAGAVVLGTAGALGGGMLAYEVACKKPASESGSKGGGSGGGAKGGSTSTPKHTLC